MALWNCLKVVGTTGRFPAGGPCRRHDPEAKALFCSGPPSMVVGPRSACRRYPGAELQQLTVDGMAMVVVLEAFGQLPPAPPVLALLAFQFAA